MNDVTEDDDFAEPDVCFLDVSPDGTIKDVDGLPLPDTLTRVVPPVNAAGPSTYAEIVRAARSAGV